MQVASLVVAARDLGGLLVFRSLPVAAFALVEREVPVRAKFAVAVTYAALSFASRVWTVDTFVWLAAAYAYYVALGSCAPAVARWLRDGRVTRGGLLAACVVAFLVVPGTAVQGRGRELALLVGWDLVLSMYSYCVEASSLGEAPSLRECLFFLLVNPALVYTRRGRRRTPPALHRRGALRSLLGLLVLLGAATLLAPACSAVEVVASTTSSEGWLALAAFGLLRLLLEYGRQSGLASLQIGLLRQVGWETPERYRWPLLATDPLDFWRRWNVYVGAWLSLYVFRPLASQWRGHGRTWRLPAAQAGAVMVTFLAIGALHDAYGYAATLDPDATWIRIFVAIGVGVVLWRGAGQAVALLTARFPAIHGFPAHRILPRCAFWATSFGFVAWGWR